MTPKPQKKASLLHQQILGELLKIRTRTRKEHRTKFDKKTQQQVDFTVDVPVPTLAGNVSEENIERAAERWSR